MISLYSMSYVDIVFNSKILASVCGEKPIDLTVAWVVWGFL